MAKAKKGHNTKQKQLKQQKKEWIPVEWQIVLLFLALGVILLVLGLAFRSSGPETLRWPMVHGEIKDAQVVAVEGAEGSAESYKLVINYTYKVKDITYTADRYSLTSDITSPNRSILEQKLEGLKVGQRISVFYNPKNPEIAVLDPGTDSAQWFLTGAGVVGGLGIFAMLLILALKKKQKQAKFKPSYTFKK